MAGNNIVPKWRTTWPFSWRRCLADNLLCCLMGCKSHFIFHFNEGRRLLWLVTNVDGHGHGAM